jgi:hypothetical protein
MTARISFVAHQDDDLIFMNPDIASDIQHVPLIPSWTVYLTAGNTVTGPDGMAYADQRINGARAAYARMAKVANAWEYQKITLPSGRELASNWLRDAPHVHLVFTFINGAHGGDPDGDLRRLWTNPSFVAQPIHGWQSYTKASLVTALKELIAHINPLFIRLTDPYGQQIGDHVDHAYAARFAATANLDTAGKTVREMHSYFGYGARTFTQNNVGAPWEIEKRDALDAYRPWDSEMAPGSWSEMNTRQHRRQLWFPGTPWSDVQP